MSIDHKTCRDCAQTLPREAFGTDVRNRDGRKGVCKGCERARLSAWRETNNAGPMMANQREKARIRANAYYHANAATVSAKQRARLQSAEAKAVKSEQDRAYREANKEQLKIRQKAYQVAARDRINAYKRANAHRYAAAKSVVVARRRAKKLNATPAWANKAAIREIYRMRLEISRATGVRHHVDHIVPLVSPLVCGLHVERNLQVLPYLANHSKSNRWWPDMWEPMPPARVDPPILEPETFVD